MTRWFEDVKNDPSNIVSSRVRLSRNWDDRHLLFRVVYCGIDVQHNKI